MTGDASRSIEQRGRDSAFPTTQATWIGARLEEGALGRDALNTHVMSRYATPLRAYVLGSSIRRIDEADALVHGFSRRDSRVRAISRRGVKVVCHCGVGL